MAGLIGRQVFDDLDAFDSLGTDAEASRGVRGGIEFDVAGLRISTGAALNEAASARGPTDDAIGNADLVGIWAVDRRARVHVRCGSAVVSRAGVGVAG